MNAPAIITRPWNYHSHVAPCETCEGVGSYWNGRGYGGNDPDSWDITCTDCDGVGHFACKVCGFDQVMQGYDCLVCDTVAAMNAKELAELDPAALSAAIVKAAEAARVAA